MPEEISAGYLTRNLAVIQTVFDFDNISRGQAVLIEQRAEEFRSRSSREPIRHKSAIQPIDDLVTVRLTAEDVARSRLLPHPGRIDKTLMLLPSDLHLIGVLCRRPRKRRD
jgi:hypothetical protein